MASWERDHTTDPALKQLAFDIETTQLQQIGRMQGWLGLWGMASEAPGGKHMAWMADDAHSHSMTSTGGVDSMPGMATSDQLRSLRAASGDQMDVLFLQLMLRHHEGGVLHAAVRVGARLGAGGAQPGGADAQLADERERVPEAVARGPRWDAAAALTRRPSHRWWRCRTGSRAGAPAVRGASAPDAVRLRVVEVVAAAGSGAATMIAVPARPLLMIPIRACLLLSDQQPSRWISTTGS